MTNMDDNQQPGEPATPDRAARTRRLPLLFIVIFTAVSIVVILTGAIVLLKAISTSNTSAPETPTKTRLEQAKDKCAPSSRDVSIGDSGRSLTVRRVAAKESRGDVSLTQLDCVFNALDVTDAVQEKINRTRALDGMQEASWGEFSASWTYHPDSGVNLTIQIN